MKALIAILRTLGTKEIHVRISAPPTKFPCYYGIDTPSKRELIANNLSQKRITTYIGADSLYYLSLEGLVSVVSRFHTKKSIDKSSKSKDTATLCDACFSGDYPAL